MSKFQFQFETLQRLREAARDDRRAHLAEALRADEILLERMQEVAAEVEEFAAQYSLPQEGAIYVDRILEAQRYELLLRGELQSLAAQRAQVETEINVRRNALTEADRQVRVLEKLSERQEKQHRQEQQRLDQRELDEVAGQRWWREAAQ